MSAPLFVLAIAYDPTKALPEVVNELKQIETILNGTTGDTKALWKVSQQDLETQFDRERERMRLLHFAGHAGSTGLELNTGQATKISFADGLAGLAGHAAGLRLIFLNGCSTEEQAKAFIDAGIPAVIATTKPLKDRFAVDFARRFYQNFTRPNSKNSLEQAFQAAFFSFNADHGSLTNDMLDEQMRGNIVVDEEANEPLYELHLHPAKKALAQERFTDWFKVSAGPDLKAAAESIRKLITGAKLEQALAEFTAVLPDEGAQLSQKFGDAKKRNLLGLSTSDEWTKARSEVSWAMLETIKVW
jgi:CHAT domain